MSVPDRRALLDRDHGDLSVRRQCRLLGLARSGVYRKRRAANDNDLGLMRRIDELFTQFPFLGSQRLALMLGEQELPINRKRMQRLMRQMGIAALGPLQYFVVIGDGDEEREPQDSSSTRSREGCRSFAVRGHCRHR